VSKERLGAFMDAVIAIVMTILVLELEKPAKPTLEAFWDLRINFAAYSLSFLWLAAMWTSLHNAWHVVDKISNRTMCLSIFASTFEVVFSPTIMPMYGFWAPCMLYWLQQQSQGGASWQKAKRKCPI